MRFESIPAGSTLSFGTRNNGYYYSDGIPWIKVSNDFIIAKEGVDYRRFNPSAVDENNYYLSSGVHSYLNSSDNIGFLSQFSDHEKTAIRPFTIRCASPRSRKKELGAYTEAECFAALPAISQLITHPEYYNTVPDEGTTFQFVPRNQIVTRSSCGKKSIFSTDHRGYLTKISVSKYISIRPIMKISTDAQFYLEAGVYRLAPDAPLMDNDALLTLIMM